MSWFNKRKSNEPDFENFPAIGGLMVSKMVAVDKKKPMFMYREKRTRREDSGWRIFSGMESQEYSDNADNVGIYNPASILKIDPSIAPLLLKGVGSVFERDPKTQKWERVDDFEMEDDYMIQHRFADKWILDINNLFEHSLEDDGDLFFTTGDKSLRIAVRNSDMNKSQLYEEQQLAIKTRDETASKTRETFEFSDAQVARVGYMIKETDDDKEYDVIYGFSIVDKQVLLIVLYFDNELDINWAIETWKSIRPASN